MKKLFLFTASAMMVLFTSCGSKGNTESAEDSVEDTEFIDDDQETEDEVVVEEEEEEVVEEEEGIYRAPFKATVQREYRDGPWEYRETYVFNILDHGRLSGYAKKERKNANLSTAPWEDESNTEFGGKWSTSAISMGDGTLDVYAIDRSDRETTYYMPATCDYIWMCDFAWMECENWNTSKALRVTSVEKL